MTYDWSPEALGKPIIGRSYRVLFLLALLPATAMAQAQPSPPLTEADAVRMALARPAVAGLVEGAVGAARGEAIEAGLWSNPVISYSREQILDGGATGADDYLTLSQEFDLGGRRALRGQAGRERVRAAEQDGAWTRAGIAAEARRLFHDVLHATGRIRAAEAWLARVDEAAKVVGRRTVAGDTSAYEHRRLLRERASAEAKVREEASALEVARSRLAALLGIANPSDLAVSGTLLPEGQPPEIDALDVRIAQRPDVKALASEVAAAGLEGRAAGRGWVPDPTLIGGMKTSKVADERGWGFVAGVSLPLTFAAHGQGEAARSAGRGRLASSRRDLLLTEAMGEVRGLRAQVIGLSEAARVFRRDAVAPSEDLARTAEAAYRAGEVGVLELLDAWRSVLDASLQVLNLEGSARRARIELDRMVGEDAR